MVIGIDGSRAFFKQPTGTENYSYQLLRALARIDQKNQYLIYLRPSVKPDGDWPANFRFKTINWPRLWTQAGLAWHTFTDVLDVLFVPAHTLPIIRKPGLKTVVTVHDLGAEYLPQMHQLKQRIYLSSMTQQQLKSATKIIAVSKATKSDLIKKAAIAPQKITVIYESYDPDFTKFKLTKNDLLVNSLRHFNLEMGNYFLFVGTVQPRKNLERVIKAYHRWLGVLSARSPIRSPRLASLAAGTQWGPPLAATPRNFPYLVIAGSKGWLSDEIYQLPERLGIADRVKFLGFVPQKDLPSLYLGAKALIFTSLFEGFGLPILEAQFFGCPVITSDVSSMPEVVGKGGILVNPLKIDDIVKAMQKIQNSKFKNQIIKAGRENLKRFSWDKAAKETLEVLETINE